VPKKAAKAMLIITTVPTYKSEVHNRNASSSQQRKKKGPVHKKLSSRRRCALCTGVDLYQLFFAWRVSVGRAVQ